MDNKMTPAERRRAENAARARRAAAARKNRKKLFTLRRLKLAALLRIVLLAFIVLAGTVTYINAKSGSKYKKMVLSQAQSRYESRVLPAKRGNIYDRNGNILATSNKVYTVILDCRAVNQNEEYVEPTIRALTGVLGLDEGDIRSRLTDQTTKDSQYQVLKHQLSMDDKKKWDQYLDIEEDSDPDSEEEPPEQEETQVLLTDAQKEERRKVKGVWFEEDYLRVYPNNARACDVIGFTFSRDTADFGIEGYYNTTLTGVDGRQYGYFNSNADMEQTFIPATEGYSLQTSLDLGAQEIVEKYVDAFNDVTGAAHVGVIVMDPKNGEILAMDGGDRYDLNHPREIGETFTSDEEQVQALYEVWDNFCVSDAFEPGSVVKPIIMGAALEKGRIAASDHFDCDGYELFGAGGNTMIRCAVYPDSHGNQTLGQVIANSCNDGMMQVAQKMGVASFITAQETFNFGSRTGIDLPNEGYGIIHNEDTMGDTELACSSFGQGFTCTMIQEASAICSVINGGYYYQPHLVTAVKDSTGGIVRQYLPMLVKQTVSESVSADIRSYMELSVTGGTSYKSRVAGYSTGGKTGTAEKLPRGNKKYLVSFIGFAPVDDPKVVVYVVVDEPKVDDQSTSSYSQYIAQGIFTELLPYLNIPRNKQTEEWDEVSLWEGFTGHVSNGSISMNPDGQIVNNRGELVDWEGRRVDEEGYLLNADGTHMVDEDGFYVLSDKMEVGSLGRSPEDLPEAISDTTIPEPLEDNAAAEYNKRESEGISNQEAELD